MQPLSLPSPHNISPYNNKALETKLAQVRTLSYDFLNNNQNFSRTVVNLSKIMHIIILLPARDSMGSIGHAVWV